MAYRSASLVMALVAAAVVLMPAPRAEAADPICAKFGSTVIAGGRYLVQNNEWGADDGQCITATERGFTVDRGVHARTDRPAAYPSIVAGCWMGTCTTGTTLPRPIQELGTLTSGIAGRIPAGTVTNLAYDLWADPTPRRNGHNTGMELMVWLDVRGGIRPIGAPVGDTGLAGATWEVWRGVNEGVPVISYVRRGAVLRADGLPLHEFVGDAVRRGVARPEWYLTNVQAGFEIWRGGPGSAIDSFSVDAAS